VVVQAILSIDQGTTNTKAVLVDECGVVVSRASATIHRSFPRRGWVEQDAAEIWQSAQVAVGDCLRAAGGITPAAIAICNQRESVVGWDRSTGDACGPVISWQDARTADTCARLEKAGCGPTVRRRTGLSLDPMFSAPKMSWLRESADRRVPLALGTIESWLIWQLTGGRVFACEAGNASRTLLYDLAEMNWNDELLAMFDIPRSALPLVRGSNAGFGTTVANGVLPAGIPIVAVLADSHAAIRRPTAQGHRS
jgi:glycerol kinase